LSSDQNTGRVAVITGASSGVGQRPPLAPWPPTATNSHCWPADHLPRGIERAGSTRVPPQLAVPVPNTAAPISTSLTPSPTSSTTPAVSIPVPAGSASGSARACIRRGSSNPSRSPPPREPRSGPPRPRRATPFIYGAAPIAGPIPQGGTINILGIATSGARPRRDGRPCSTHRRRPCRSGAECTRRTRGTRRRTPPRPPGPSRRSDPKRP
jgi:hypothetical protein